MAQNGGMISTQTLQEVNCTMGGISVCVSYLPTKDHILRSLEFKLKGGVIAGAGQSQRRESAGLQVSKYLAAGGGNTDQPRNRFYSDQESLMKTPSFRAALAPNPVEEQKSKSGYKFSLEESSFTDGTTPARRKETFQRAF